MVHTCQYCGKEFERCQTRAKYCSRRCMGLAWRKPRQTSTCEHCGQAFTVSYKRSGKARFCSKRCKSLSQRFRTTEDILSSATAALRLEHSLSGQTLTLAKTCQAIGLSSKSWARTGTRFSELCQSLGLPVPMSKFQDAVLHHVEDIFEGYAIVSEYTHTDLVNPDTGARLRIDIVLPELYLAIACQGTQHFDPDSYYAKLSQERGYITPQESDCLKLGWCKKHGFHFVQIPYRKVVKQNYVLSFLPSSLYSRG